MAKRDESGGLWEYAVLYWPPEDADPEVIVPVTTIAAVTEREVRMRAARSIPTTHADKLSQIDVVVRPFR